MEKRIAVDGRAYPLSKLRRIKGEYYVMNQHCYKMSDGKWHRVGNGKIDKLYGTNEYRLIAELKSDKNITRGIVNGNGDIGWFVRNPYENVVVNNVNEYGEYNSIMGISAEAIADGYHLPLSDIYYYPNSARKSRDRKKAVKDNNLSYSYGANNRNSAYRSIREKYEQYKHPKINSGVKKYAKYLTRSFGCEFETYTGNVPTNMLYKLGLVTLRDGSLNGGLEFTTVPLMGEKGCQSLYDSCEILSERAAVNEHCALHFHFGIPYTGEKLIKYALAMWKVYAALEDEIREFTLPFRRRKDFLASKNKDHCADLPKLNFLSNSLGKASGAISRARYFSAREELTMFLTGYPWDILQEEYDGLHPRRNDNKWNSTSRYLSFNVLPALFTEGETFEFRAHEGTVNKVKTINWLFICNAILEYADRNMEQILLKGKLKLTLTDCLKVYVKDDAGAFLAEYLMDYIENKKRVMNESKNTDYGLKILSKDAQIKYQYRGVRCLFD